MRIAFASHEFPPDTGGGGIGTYLDQIACHLAQRGHSVEVFCGAAEKAGSQIRSDGVQVHRVAAYKADAFREAIVAIFSERHAAAAFDVLEGNDFDAPGNRIKETFPQLPYVVKLHTPRFAIDEMHFRPLSPLQRVRMTAGALRKGRWPQFPGPVRATDSAKSELRALAIADEIASPSEAIAASAAEWESSVKEKTSVFPYPYAAKPQLLAIPAGGNTRRITFLGRIEQRKGVMEFAEAIPLVFKKHPDALFRFIGRSMPHPDGTDMRTLLEARLTAVLASIEFTGALPPASVITKLAETDILVAPSHWESFGLVCCEGLAAARAVVGSTAGGMVEILDGGRCGKLVPPHNPAALASAISELIENPEQRRHLGEAGRQRVLDHFAPDRVVAQQLASYERAISRCANNFSKHRL